MSKKVIWNCILYDQIMIRYSFFDVGKHLFSLFKLDIRLIFYKTLSANAKIKYLISNYIFTTIQKSIQIDGLMICRSPDCVGIHYTSTQVKHMNSGHFGIIIKSAVKISFECSSPTSKCIIKLMHRIARGTSFSFTRNNVAL